MSFAGVSVIADGRLQTSTSSAIYSGMASGYHLVVVEGYSRTKGARTVTSIKCRPFRIGGYRWVLHFFPNDSIPEVADFISVVLQLDQDVGHPVKAHCEFRHVENHVSTHIRTTETLDFAGKYWGCQRFMKKELLQQPKYLTEDCFIIRCDVIVTNPAPDTPSIEVPPSNMQQHFSDLLLAKQGTDVTFEVGGETFVAHRCVLAAQSTVFKAELFGPMKEGTTTGAIKVQDMEAKLFKALLCFVYTDQLPEQEIDNMEEEEGEEENKKIMWLQHLLVGADRYDLQRLKLMCEVQLSEQINVSSVASVLALAEKHHCRGLKAVCLHFLRVQSPQNLEKIMASNGWEHITVTYPSVLNELISKLVSKV